MKPIEGPKENGDPEQESEEPLEELGFRLGWRRIRTTPRPSTLRRPVGGVSTTDGRRLVVALARRTPAGHDGSIGQDREGTPCHSHNL